MKSPLISSLRSPARMPLAVLAWSLFNMGPCGAAHADSITRTAVFEYEPVAGLPTKATLEPDNPPTATGHRLRGNNRGQ